MSLFPTGELGFPVPPATVGVLMAQSRNYGRACITSTRLTVRSFCSTITSGQTSKRHRHDQIEVWLTVTESDTDRADKRGFG